MLRSAIERLEPRLLFTWIGATSGSTNNAAHNYNNTANWVGGVIDDSFAGVALTANTTLYFTANRTTTGNLNLGYTGNYALTLESSSSTAHTLTLTAGIAGTFPSTDSATIGSPTDPLNLDMNGGASVFNLNAGDTLNIQNTLTDGTLDKTGAGTLMLAGADNFAGGTTLAAGTLDINSPTALGTGLFTIDNNSTIDNTSGASITLTSNNPQAWAGNFTFTGTGPLNMGTGAITGVGNVQLTVGSSTLTEAGVIAGAVGMTKLGAGTLALTAANTYTGPNNVNAGTVLIDNGTGSGTGAGPVQVGNGATLGGTGIISGAVNVANGATLQPGTTSLTGILTVGGLTIGAGGTLAMAVNGSTPGAGYDQIIDTGNLNIANSTLDLTGTAVLSSGNPVTLLQYTDTATPAPPAPPPNDAFTGHPEGSAITLNGVRSILSYAGGASGDNIVLTAFPFALIGSETLVNSASDAGNQQFPAIAMDDAGNYVVVWEDPSNGGEVNARLYNADGTPAGSEFTVSTAATGPNPLPSVSMNASGKFVVCWNGNGNTVYAGVFNPSGHSLGANITVTTSRQGNSPSSVAMAANGAFDVAFEGNESADNDGIYVQRFTPSRSASGSPILVNTTTAGPQANPSIATDANGDSVVTWTDKSPGQQTIKAALLPASGLPSTEFVVGSVGANEDLSAVGMDASGNFVVAWTGTGPGQGIFTRRYSSTGTALDAAPVQLTDPGAGPQTKPAIAVRPDGSYLVAWTANTLDGTGTGVYAQAFAANGSASTTQFLVNTTTQGNQQDAATAWYGGNLTVAWDGQGAGDNNGVFVQNYATSTDGPSIASAASASPSPVTAMTTTLSVLGADAAGASSLTYSWATTGSPPAPVTFSANGTNAAQNVVATFAQAGTYNFLVTITDPNGLTVTSSTSVTVNQTLTRLAVTPNNTSLSSGLTQAFSAQAVDQFGQTMTTPSLTWSSTGGTISLGGLLLTPLTSGPVTVSASHGNVVGTSTVNIVNSGSAEAAPNTVTSTTTTLSVLNGATSGVTYDWSAIAVPPGAQTPTISPNNTAAAQSATATFDDPGNYTFQVIITQLGLTSTQTVAVTVDQTLSRINVSPTGLTLDENAQQPLTAGGFDQFGHAMTLSPVSWALQSGSGSVNSTGIYTAPGPGITGTAVISASSSGVTGTASITTIDPPPTVQTPASASLSTVVGTTTNLSVLGADAAGQPSLTYTWATTGTPPAPVTFTVNGTNAAQNSTAIFTAPGTYNFTVTITDTAGESATSSVAVTVNQTLASITVDPTGQTLDENGRQQFTAHGADQFGHAMSLSSVSWAVQSGVGSVDGAGLYTAPGSGATGAATVSASSGGIIGTASINTRNAPPTVQTPASASLSTVIGTSTDLSVLGADDGGETNLTYTWTTTGPVPAPVTFTTNASNAAKDTSAIFTKAGNYDFLVTITDAGGDSTTSSVAVTVNQTLTNLTLSPTSATIAEAAQQQFSVSAFDQFGNPVNGPQSFAWSVPSGGGSIDDSGFYTAGASQGSIIVAVADGGLIRTANLTVVNVPPTVAAAPSISADPITTAAAQLSVLGASHFGQSTLTYSWSLVGSPPGAAAFSDNASNSARNTTVTFAAPGTYDFQVRIADPEGGSVTATVSANVISSLATIAITPHNSSVERAGSVQFVAVAYDQFGNALPTQPAFSWSIGGSVGSIDGSGLYTAPPAAVGIATVTAATSGFAGSATVSFINKLSEGGPAAQSTHADTQLTLTGADAISITDGDPNTAAVPVSVTLSAQHGALRLASQAGLIFSTGTGSGDIVTTFTGDLVAVNRALAGLVFMPDHAFAGTAYLTASIDEVGNGVTLASRRISIDVVGSLILPQLPANGSSTLPTVPVAPTSPDSAPSTSNNQPSRNTGGGVGGMNGTVRQIVSPAILPAGLQVSAHATPVSFQAAVADSVSEPVANQAGFANRRADEPVQSVVYPIAAEPTTDVLDQQLQTSAPESLQFLDSQNPTWSKVDRLEDQIGPDKKTRISAGVATATSVGASAVYLLWLMRGGSLVSSLMSVMPSWKTLDPLPVLDNFENKRKRRRRRKDEADAETLESLLDRADQAQGNAPPEAQKKAA